jgi:hypothetical protein
MPTPDQILVYATSAGALLFAAAKVMVPIGLAGTALELVGKHFGLPKVEAFGDKLEKLAFDLGDLFKSKAGK